MEEKLVALEQFVGALIGPRAASGRQHTTGDVSTIA